MMAVERDSREYIKGIAGMQRAVNMDRREQILAGKGGSRQLTDRTQAPAVTSRDPFKGIRSCSIGPPP